MYNEKNNNIFKWIKLALAIKIHYTNVGSFLAKVLGRKPIKNVYKKYDKILVEVKSCLIDYKRLKIVMSV